MERLPISDAFVVAATVGVGLADHREDLLVNPLIGRSDRQEFFLGYLVIEAIAAK
jgi:hypothetical protein